MEMESAGTCNLNETSEKLRVLILEDMPTDAQLMVRELDKAGFDCQTRTVDSKSDFVRELETWNPDIVLSDYALPGFSGLQALELVKARFPKIPLIIVTGSINEMTAVDCLIKGAANYVLKEFLARLGPAVRGALQEKQLRQEKEKAEKALQAAVREWRTTFDAISDRICVMDDNGRIIRCNRAMKDMLGKPWREIIGSSPCNRLHGIDDFMPDCPFRLALQTNNKETTIWKKGEKYFDITVEPIKDEQGNFKGAVHIITDISERKNLELQLRHTHKMEAIGTLAGGIAHDFNNLLSPILGYAEMALENLPPDGQATEDIRMILNAACRARDLVSQILSFSRKDEHELRPLKIQYALKETLKLLRSTIPANIEIRQEIDQQCESVMADPSKVHQIIMNLCTNAYHAMRDQGGVMLVGLASTLVEQDDFKTLIKIRPGTYVRLEVSDTGHGMDPDVMERIFEPYFTTKKQNEGTGLGLFVVHGIIENLGGQISVYSEPGRGTTFHVYFPVMKQQNDSAADVENSAPVLSGCERILVVDDEEALIQLEKYMLTSLGYKVTTCTCSEKCLEIFQARPDDFDLLITDMTMPKMTGDVLARKVLALRPGLPVLLLSGYSERISREKVQYHGISRFLMKPVTKKDLAAAVRQVLDESPSRASLGNTDPTA